MYFQKLENLYNSDIYINKKILVDAFDEWLAFVPRSYRDRLTPDMFQNSEGVHLEDTVSLFEDAVKMKILVYRYMLVCKCGQVINFYNNELEAIDALSSYCDDYEEKCPFCEKHEELTTDNILILYKLIIEPKNISNKKKIIFPSEENQQSVKSMSNIITKDLKKYTDYLGIDSLYKVGNSEIRKSLLVLKDN